MNDLIAFCGLDCAVCEAREATVNNDNDLRLKVANLWSDLNGIEITAEMINCSGCRPEGPKTPYCESICPIRKCASGKGIKTCGCCEEMDACEKLRMITSRNTVALYNLKQNK